MRRISGSFANEINKWPTHIPMIVRAFYSRLKTSRYGHGRDGVRKEGGGVLPSLYPPISCKPSKCHELVRKASQWHWKEDFVGIHAVLGFLSVYQTVGLYILHVQRSLVHFYIATLYMIWTRLLGHMIHITVGNRPCLPFTRTDPVHASGKYMNSFLNISYSIYVYPACKR